jgi:hypothetical protein
MFKIYKKYILISILIFLISGCADRRVITIDTSIKKPSTRVVHRRPRKNRVKEEILIKNNPKIVSRRVVKVPKNHPTLDIRVTQIKPKEVVAGAETIERMPFPEDEYRELKRNGDSTVRGRVFLENSINDERIVKKNLKLYLNPVTSYSRQWYQDSYLGGYKMTKPDKRLFNYLKFTTTNHNGAFSFFGVPAGDYYIGVKLKCSSECGYETPKIIRVVKEVSVGYGTTEVDLTKVVP